MVKINFRRKLSSVLIDPQFQLKFSSLFLLLATANSVTMFLATRYMFWSIRSSAKHFDVDSLYFKFLSNQEFFMIRVFIVANAVSFCILLISGIIFSHKIAGPLYRLRKHFEALAAGETNADVTFRKNDYFQNVADACNLHLAKHREQVQPRVEPSFEQISKKAS